MKERRVNRYGYGSKRGSRVGGRRGGKRYEGRRNVQRGSIRKGYSEDRRPKSYGSQIPRSDDARVSGKPITYRDVSYVMGVLTAYLEDAVLPGSVIPVALSVLEGISKYVRSDAISRGVGWLRFIAGRSLSVVRRTAKGAEIAEGVLAELQKLPFVKDIGKEISVVVKEGNEERELKAIIATAVIRNGALSVMAWVQSASQSGRWYRVELVYPIGVFIEPLGGRCSCSDFTYRGGKKGFCKHIRWLHEGLVRALKNGELGELIDFNSYVFSYWK